MPAFDASSSDTTNMLLMALDEMDKIIAESKLSLDSLSTSTNTLSNSFRPEGPVYLFDQRSPHQPNGQSSVFKYQGSLPGNSSNGESDYHADLSEIEMFSAGRKSMLRNGHRDSRLLSDIVNQLKNALSDESDLHELQHVSKESKEFIINALGGSVIPLQKDTSQNNGTRPDRLGDAVKSLENERHSLQMQLVLLSNQVNDQAAKIQELEDLLSEKNCQLDSTEALLQEEMLARSSLETYKLDLLAEVTDMRAQMLATKKEMTKKSQSGSDASAGSGEFLDRPNEESKQNNIAAATQMRTEAEQDRMKKTVDVLTAALQEKDMRIRDLQERLGQPRDGPSRVMYHGQEDVYSLSRKPPLMARPHASTLSPRRPAYPLTLAHQTLNNSAVSDESLTRYAETMSQLSEGNYVSTSSRAGSRREVSSMSNSRSPKRSRSSDARVQRASNRELAHWRSGSFRAAPLSPSKSMGDRMCLASSPSVSAYGNNGSARHGSLDSYGGPYYDINRCNSVPNLGRLGTDTDQIRCSTPKSGTADDKKHGIRKFFEKLTKNHASELTTNSPSPHFKRGGIRATAGARLQHSHSGQHKKWDPTIPVQNWTHEMVLQWFEEVHIPLARSARTWIVNGDQILKTPIAELEKELNLATPLLRKKFNLALKAAEDLDQSVVGKWDYLWVLRWLDDIGLPQYKDAFAEERVDGRTLNLLTTDDLFQLKVTNAIHHASIAQGIQVLRSCDYDPTCIRRRPVKPDVPLESPNKVIYWSTHRIMEWLRHLDLTEYGPNLRGSGVHGGLIILENRFNADVLADLLSIPQSKTLLRRHLNKSFVELVGSEMIRQKRAAEAAPGFVPLSPHLKLKQARKGFTLSRRKGKSDDDFVCPLEQKIDFFFLGGSSEDAEADNSKTGYDRSPSKSTSASPVLPQSSVSAEISSPTSPKTQKVDVTNV